MIIQVRAWWLVISCYAFSKRPQNPNLVYIDRSHLYIASKVFSMKQTTPLFGVFCCCCFFFGSIRCSIFCRQTFAWPSIKNRALTVFLLPSPESQFRTNTSITHWHLITANSAEMVRVAAISDWVGGMAGKRIHRLVL